MFRAFRSRLEPFGLTSARAQEPLRDPSTLEVGERVPCDVGLAAEPVFLLNRVARRICGSSSRTLSSLDASVQAEPPDNTLPRAPDRCAHDLAMIQVM